MLIFNYNSKILKERFRTTAFEKKKMKNKKDLNTHNSEQKDFLFKKNCNNEPANSAGVFHFLFFLFQLCFQASISGLASKLNEI